MRGIYFFYPKGKKLTGQEMASKLILSNMPEIDFKVCIFPALERSSKNPFYYLMYFFKVFLSWLRILSLIFVKSPVIYANMGQGRMSLLRDGRPLQILSWFKSYSMVISLHGHLFTTWSGEEKVCLLFVSVLKKASLITVLGDVQKDKLVELGIAEEKILIVPNTCEIEAVKNKQTSDTVNLLYLSNLIEDKGYLEYLQAVESLSTSALDKKVHAVLCGNLYSGEEDKSAVIQKHIDSINSSENVRIEWRKGAYGDEKGILFEKTDIFIFPSKYKVEAQPIVLIEAMASGCAVITTKVGEIPSTVSKECAVLLDNANPDDINAAVIELLNDAEQLQKKQGASVERFQNKFSIEIYKKNWTQIFEKLNR